MKVSSESIAGENGTDAARVSGKNTKRVLLAWDDPLARQILAAKLQSVGFDVEEAGDAAVAMSKLHSTHPHAVFLQFSLQGSQGVEFVKDARRDTKFAERPIYVCTVCSSLSTWTRRTANAGPTKFFNMLATPVETIVAKVMRDVTRVGVPDGSEESDEAEAAPIVRREVPDQLKKNVANLIRDLAVIAALRDQEMRVAKCAELRRSVHSVMSSGAVAGLIAMARLAAATENLLKALCASPTSITKSSLDSIGGALQILVDLCGTSSVTEETQPRVLTAVVLADEARVRSAACNALIGAGFETNSFSDPSLILNHLATSRADIIVLGWSVPAKASEIYGAIRALPMQETAPVIVVPSPSGSEPAPLDPIPGAEVLVQPFSFAEVAVRSLTLVCRHDLSNQPTTISVGAAEPESNLAAALDQPQANTVAAFSKELRLPPQEETKDIPMKTSEEVLEEVVTPQARGIKPAAAKDPAGRCRELEEELSGMGHLCGELLAKYTTEQQTAAEAAQRGAALEEQLAERNRELEKVKTELERLTTESQRLETENRALQDGKKAVETEFVAIQAKAGPRDSELADLQQRFDEAASGRARLSADLERERAERRRIEQRAASLATQLQEMHARTGQHLEAERLSQERISALEKQLREREDALARATADLEKDSAERHSAEEQLRAAGALIAQLQNSVSSFEGARKAMQRRHDDLEKQLQSSIAAAAESAARADKDSRECERLEKALSAAESARQQQATEVSKLQCALEVEQAEKNRLEGEAAQLRYSSADSARTGLTTLNRLRSETRAPVSNLMQATRQLLEVELPDETKALVTSVLDNALLLQSKLHENGASKGGTAAPESTFSAAATPSDP